jgi:hypothetical protein
VTTSRTSQSRSLTAVALVAMGLGVLGLMSVAGAPVSAVSPSLPAGAGPLLPFRWLSDWTGVSQMTLGSEALLAVISVGACCAGFLIGAYLAWTGALGLRTVVIVSLLLIAVSAALPLLFSHDVLQYGIYGRIVSIHHANPYVSVPSDFSSDPFNRYADPEYAAMPSVYGPAFLDVAAIVTRVVRSPSAVILAFKSLAALSAGAALVCIVVLARRIQPERASLAVVLFGWNPAVMLLGVGGGHTDIMLALALVGALILVAPPRGRASGGRQVAATAVLAVATSIKVSLAIPLILLIVAAAARARLGRRLPVALLHIAVAIAVGLAFGIPFLQGTNPTLGVADVSRLSNGLSAERALESLVRPFLEIVSGQQKGGVATSYLAQGAVRGLLIVTFGFLCWLILRRGDRLRVTELGALCGWSLMVLALAGPLLFPWYAAWFAALIWLANDLSLVVASMFGVLLSIVSVVIRAERVRDAYNASVLIGEEVIGPIILACFLALIVQLYRKWWASTHWSYGHEMGDVMAIGSETTLSPALVEVGNRP